MRADRSNRVAPMLALTAVLGAVAFAPGLEAQAGGDGFLFKQPVVSLGFRAGYAMPSASSELFGFTEEQLTIGPGDWNGTAFGFDLGIRASQRFDVVVGAGYTVSETDSEFRDWVDLDDLPIQQTTAFRQVPLTFGLKAYLRDRGRQVGRLAWIPASWNAYVGAGGGWVWWEFEQVGDFVDFQTLDIFPDVLVDDGRAPTLHLFGGAEYALTPNLLVSLEGRYQHAEAEMGRDFRGFEPLDLSGFNASAGISLRF